LADRGICKRVLKFLIVSKSFIDFLTNFASRLAPAFWMHAVSVKYVVEHLGRIVENSSLIGNADGLLNNAR
jgi:hypothetical protein